MGRIAILLACALFSSCALAQDPQPPTQVIARAHTVNQIMITWRDPDVPGGRAPPRGRLYLINFRATHPWQTSFQEEQADEAWGALENLSPFTRYEIFINIVQDGRVSEPSELVAVTTVVLEAKGSPTSVPIIESVEEYGGYDTVNGLIRWTTKNDPDNELTGHIIFYTEVDSAEYSQSYMSWPIKRIDGKDTRAVIEGLKPETQYGFIVQAFNAMGGGPISMVYYYKTPSRRRGPGVVDVDSATTGKCPPGVREVKCPVDPCENSQCPHYRCKANFCGGCNAEHFDIFGKKVECQSQAVQHGCRPGVEIVNCGNDPCDKAKCPKYPNAQCRSNYCGGCNADFYDIYGNKVDCRLGVSNRDNDYYGCPPGVAIVACRVDPCLAATCPRYPNARCKFNFCGGCNTEFFGDDGSPVECGNGGTHSSSQCPLGVPLINCVRNPCDGKSCAANPSARCKPNYCGDCKAEFFDGNGNQVSCDIQVTPEKPGECPAVSGSSFGTCAELCSSDDDCQSDYKCCSNGCGHECKPPAEKPGSCPGIDATRNIYFVCAEKCGSDYDCAGDEKCCSNGCGHVCLNAEETMREKPGTCPVVDGGPVGVCAEMCTIDQECPGDQKCCSNGCGHVCTVVGSEPEIVPADEPPCEKELQDMPNPFPPGMMVPRCTEEGYYDKEQCHDGQCWCTYKNGNEVENTRRRGRAPCNKEGTCPAADPNILGSCVEECSRDHDCEEDMKCCSNGCGHVCVSMKETLVPEEPPCNVELRQAYDSGSRDVFFPRCSQDGFYEKEQCWHSKRECWCTTRLGKEVDGTRRQGRTNCEDVSKPGECPVVRGNDGFGICVEECSSDGDCSGEDKCCSNGCGHTCVKPLKLADIKKPGECPVASGDRGFGICVEECSSDGDCSGDEKCCSNGCGHTCVKPLQVSDVEKPGECPFVRGNDRVGICVEECSSDGDCSGKDKCCSNGCGHTCVKPLGVSDVEKPGECPVAGGGGGFGICVEECSSDGDCSGDEKCCSNGCGHTCVKPVQVSDVVEKPGECPFVRGNDRVGICVEECSSDGDCSGKDKCCSNGCGHTCVKPFGVSDVEKPGECPVASGGGGFGICVEECSSDGDCSGDEKCCSNGCGHTCVKPLQVSDVEKPGECPVVHGNDGFGICVEECSSDSDCSGDEKCCSNGCGHTCVRPLQVADIEKPGECPFVRGNDRVGICVEECSSDGDCSGKDKCCSNGCGHTCVKPLGVSDVKKLGECPAASGDQGFGICVEECSSDGDCSGDEKCCSNGCGHTCVKPLAVPEKPGTCPPTQSGSLGTCVEECRNDHDCQEDQKCCSNGCGHVCLHAIYIQDIEKPGECPFVRGNDGFGTCVEECSSDGDCSGDEKCCSNGCGHTCVKPLAVPEKPGTCPAVQSDSIGACVEECRDDYDCQGDQKCCSNGCGHVCRHTIDVKVPEKEGRCPAVGLGVGGICVEDCNNDFDCEGDEKCCSNGCGHTCIRPQVSVIIKSGECPAVEKGAFGTCFEFCTHDGDCPGTDKCCSNGCGHTCVSPAKKEKPGSCPAVEPGVSGVCIEFCSSDDDCIAEEKCCSNGCGHICLPPFDLGGGGGGGGDNRKDEGDLPDCQKELQEVQRRGSPPGSFTPTCAGDGYYHKKQCYHSIGYCWCSSKDGEEVAGTRTNVRYGDTLDCDKPGTCPAVEPGYFGSCAELCTYDHDCPGDEKCCSNGCGHSCIRVPAEVDLPPCHKELRDADRQGPLLGAFKPTCRDDGYYDKKQCHKSIGYCWCTNKDGEEVEGTRTNVRTGDNLVCDKPGTCPAVEPAGSYGSCAELCTYDHDCPGDEKCCSNGCGHSCIRAQPEEELPPCHKELKEVKSRGRLIGAFKPRCTDDGYYQKKQCWGSTGHCWCASKDGQEVEGTKTRGPLECDKPGTCPAVQSDSVGICAELCDYDHDCDGEEKCCSNGCGHVCVRIEPSEPPCTAAVREAYANFVQGKHIPYCDEDGYYEKEQCDPTTRECWCSDRYGKEVEGSRQRGRTRC